MKLKTIILTLLLAAVTAFAAPQNGQFTVSYFLGADTNQTGTNFLSATNAAQARARIEAPSYGDVTNIAQQYGGSGVTNIGLLSATNLPSTVAYTSSNNTFAGTQTIGTANVTNLNIGGMTIFASPTNSILLTNALNSDTVLGFFTPLSATTLTNSVSGSFIITNNGAWRVLAANGQEHYNFAGTSPVGTWSVSTYGSAPAPASTLVAQFNGPFIFGGVSPFLLNGITGIGANLFGTFAGSFNGNGYSVTNLQSTNLVGTIPDTLLSGNVLTNGSLISGSTIIGSLTNNTTGSAAFATNATTATYSTNSGTAGTATNAPNGLALNSFSAGLSSLLSEGYQTNVPTSGTTFETMPKSTLSPDRKTIYRVWGAATINGVANSSIKFDCSTNGGLSFSTPVVAFTNAAYDMRDSAFGCTSQGRLVIIHSMYSLTNAVYGQAVVAVSDNKGVSWTDNYATISTNGMSHYVAPAVMVPHGAITEIDGKLICGFYNQAGTWPIYCLVGTLDASSWTNFYIASGGSFAEPEILPVNSSVWYCVTRRLAWTVGNPCTLWDYWTTNAGTTWSDRPYDTGITTITTNGTYSSPVSLNKFETEDGTYISMVFGDRLSGNLYLGAAPFTQVWTNSSMLVSNAIVIGRINTNIVNGVLDGGYPSAVIPGRGIEHHVSFYNLPNATTANIKMVKATPKIQHFGKFSGDGSGLTNLNAANLTGTLPAWSVVIITTNPPMAGAFIGSPDSTNRAYSFDGSSLTNSAGTNPPANANSLVSYMQSTQAIARLTYPPGMTTNYVPSLTSTLIFSNGILYGVTP